MNSHQFVHVRITIVPHGLIITKSMLLINVVYWFRVTKKMHV